MLTAEELAARLTAEAAAVESEMEEIDLLVTQAKTEAARHETRRAAAGEKITTATTAATSAAWTLISSWRRPIDLRLPSRRSIWASMSAALRATLTS